MKKKQQNSLRRKIEIVALIAQIIQSIIEIVHLIAFFF